MTQRTFAIGDIHGCLGALESLLASIRPTAEDLLVFLGDYVDRGPASEGVIATLIDLERACPTVFVRGNHDELMLEARADTDVRNAWMSYGAVETIDSYGPQAYPRCVPAPHWDFLSRTVDFYETSSHILVHAPIRPELGVGEQTADDWRWSFAIPDEAHCSGKQVVCGHVLQRDGRPSTGNGLTMIDTGASVGLWLTALHLEAGDAIQADERGDTRILPAGSFRRRAIA